jgi:hypothetical protein
MSSEKIQSFKKASKSLKKYLKLHAFFKKASYSEKKKRLAAIATMASPPLARS